MDNKSFKRDIHSSTNDTIKYGEKFFNSPRKFFKSIKKVHSFITKTSEALEKIRKFIIVSIGVIKSIFLFLMSFPVLVIAIILVCLFSFIYIAFVGDKNYKNLNEYKKMATVLTKDEMIALWIELTDKWKIKECEWLVTPNIIYTSNIDWYLDTLKDESWKGIQQLCLYNLIFSRYIKWDFEIKTESWSMSNTNSTGSNLLEKKKGALSKLWLKPFNLNTFNPYKPDEYWFWSRFNFPYQTFNTNWKILDLLYNYYFTKSYSYTISQKDNELFWLYTWSTIWTWWTNVFNELNWLNNDKETSLMLNDKFKITNDMDSISNYYHFNCPPCTWEKCTCTWDPQTDYQATFVWDKKALAIFNKYIEFIDDLNAKNVVYASENILSPFRNYEKWWVKCNTNITLTQRDWQSNLMFFGFKWYPSVGWVPTHAWLDLVWYSDCDRKNPPVYSIADWVVVWKSYSLTSWWNSLVIKSYILWWEYYIRYSHLNESSPFDIWDTVDFNQIIWFQWRTWPATWEHLDLTIYVDSDLAYSHYLRNTLWLWWIFPYTFEDVLKWNWWSVSINHYTNNCFNCN